MAGKLLALFTVQMLLFQLESGNTNQGGRLNIFDPLAPTS
jgi:hypothetical protein